jgi:TIR domain
MAVVWLTYSWADDEDQTVQWIASQLEGAGLTVRLDKWDLDSGRRLWEQIGEHISDPAKTDAWMVYATINSVSSERCKEELYTAIDRALNARGQHFPVLALFPSATEIDLLPPALRNRLNVSLEDQDWIERIVAAAEGRQARIARPEIGPYAIRSHRTSARHFVEIRPRAGVTARFFVGVPASEEDALDPSISFGPSGRLPGASLVDTPRDDHREITGTMWRIMSARNQVTPSISCFLGCNEAPSRIIFGEFDRQTYLSPDPARPTQP